MNMSWTAPEAEQIGRIANSVESLQAHTGKLIDDHEDRIRVTETWINKVLGAVSLLSLGLAGVGWRLYG